MTTRWRVFLGGMGRVFSFGLMREAKSVHSSMDELDRAFARLDAATDEAERLRTARRRTPRWADEP